MAYEPKEWACGDVVTADALNHLEQGVAEASSGGASAGDLTYNGEGALDAFTGKGKYIKHNGVVTVDFMFSPKESGLDSIVIAAIPDKTCKPYIVSEAFEAYPIGGGSGDTVRVQVAYTTGNNPLLKSVGVVPQGMYVGVVSYIADPDVDSE